MYYMGFSYWECYNIPVQYREWFKRRLLDEIKKSREKGDSSSRAAHDNTPELRALTDKSRADTPARLRRFT
jgi:hypothetical protein